MKKAVIGYIFDDRKLGADEKTFSKVAKENNIELVMFNTAKEIYEEEIEEKAKRCDVGYNNSAEDIAIEISKTLEELGVKMIESSNSCYYPKDKWIFFVKCKEKNKWRLKHLVNHFLNFVFLALALWLIHKKRPV